MKEEEIRPKPLLSEWSEERRSGGKRFGGGLLKEIVRKGRRRWEEPGLMDGGIGIVRDNGR